MDSLERFFRPACDAIRPGGLMRCCIDTIHAKSPEYPQEGDFLDCDWCSDSVQWKNGAWEWIGARPIPQE